MRLTGLRTLWRVMSLDDSRQSAFAAAVLDPAKAVPAGLARSNGGPVLEAFNVYRNNVVASLAEALKAAFPVTAQLLGEGLARALMADFARQHPPRHAFLGGYGDGLAAFLQQHPATRAKPFLGDIARLERLRLDAYHGADAPVLDAAELAALDPDALSAGRLVLHPAVRLFASAFPVGTIHAIESAALAGSVVEDRASVDLKVSERVLVVRPLYEVSAHNVDQGSFAFLQACEAGLSIADAADAGFDEDPDFDFQACLALCLSAGVFTAYQPADPLEVPHGVT